MTVIFARINFRVETTNRFREFSKELDHTHTETLEAMMDFFVQYKINPFGDLGKDLQGLELQTDPEPTRPSGGPDPKERQLLCQCKAWHRTGTGEHTAPTGTGADQKRYGTAPEKCQDLQSRPRKAQDHFGTAQGGI